MMKIVLDAGYHGYVGIEWEGDKPERDRGRQTDQAAPRTSPRQTGEGLTPEPPTLPQSIDFAGRTSDSAPAFLFAATLSVLDLNAIATTGHFANREKSACLRIRQHGLAHFLCKHCLRYRQAC